MPFFALFVKYSDNLLTARLQFGYKGFSVILHKFLGAFFVTNTRFYYVNSVFSAFFETSHIHFDYHCPFCLCICYKSSKSYNLTFLFSATIITHGDGEVCPFSLPPPDLNIKFILDWSKSCDQIRRTGKTHPAFYARTRWICTYADSCLLHLCHMLLFLYDSCRV